MVWHSSAFIQVSVQIASTAFLITLSNVYSRFCLVSQCVRSTPIFIKRNLSILSWKDGHNTLLRLKKKPNHRNCKNINQSMNNDFFRGVEWGLGPFTLYYTYCLISILPWSMFLLDTLNSPRTTKYWHDF